MMVPKKSLILAGAALFTVGAFAGAQSQSGKVFQRYTKPLRTVSLDLETGAVTRGPVVQQQNGTTTSDFPNIDLGGFVGVDTGGCACEWIDAGTKGINGNASDLMNNIVFAYCGALLDPLSGGPGGSVKLGFYEGYAVGGGAATTTVAAFTLTGLPANTASSSFFGGFRCFFINVTFANLVCFADGPIGYSWKFLDLGLDGTLAGTWPFLSCVQSCTGIGPDATGMVDLVDQYCPPGSLLSTFSFGTTPFGGYFTSISMDVREATDCTATVFTYGGQGINLDSLSASTAVIPGTWTAQLSVNDPCHTGNGVWIILVRATALLGGGPRFVIVGPVTELLVANPFLSNLSAGPHGPAGSTANFAGPIPKDMNLIGLAWAGQSLTTGGCITFSSAVAGVTGTN